MLQAYATQMALDKLDYENETIDIAGFNHEIKKAKILYFAKASLTSDILISKLAIFEIINSIFSILFQKYDGFYS